MKTCEFYGKRMTWLRDSEYKDKKIVLFDMDGTLTEPRKEFDRDLIESLRNISLFADIGIVSGSDYDYIYQQMEFLIEQTEMKYRTHILPCNGTKYYKPPSHNDDKHKLVYETNMKEEIGDSLFTQLMVGIMEQQASGNDVYKIPLTGHFIQYRGSMINWCPIGRNASSEERKQFVEYDNSFKPTYRSRTMDLLKHRLSVRGLNVSVKFGGDTSFDIYPKGWDKTYCLKHFRDYKHWFVGDRCEIGGNDREIYELLERFGRSFKTESTKDTKLIIDDKILPKLEENFE